MEYFVSQRVHKKSSQHRYRNENHLKGVLFFKFYVKIIEKMMNKPSREGEASRHKAEAHSQTGFTSGCNAAASPRMPLEAHFDLK